MIEEVEISVTIDDNDTILVVQEHEQWDIEVVEPEVLVIELLNDVTDGRPGRSAYEDWLLVGNVGTVQDFLNSLKGLPGTPAPGGTGHIHTQVSPSNEWTVVHNLGYRPAGIKIIDTAGDEWIGKVTYLNINSYTINFGLSSFGGQAFSS